MKLQITLLLLFLAQLMIGQDRIRKIDSLLNTYYASGKINGNFLVAEKGKIIYFKSFGYANEEKKELLDTNSIFELASCSKQFTAMSILLLKEKKKLNLDDEISKYLPELSNYKGITIRHLLNHTGGLPDYMELMDSVYDKSTIATNNDIIAVFTKHQPEVLFAPNTKYEYSNTGYALLASIVERVSGISFADFLGTNIFKPLNMTNSFVYNRRQTPKQITNYAFGYIYSDSLKKYVLPDEIPETKFVYWLDGIVGDGCVNSTVTDLLKWDRALYSTKLLSKKTTKELFTVAKLNDKSKTNYGFGWQVDKHPVYGKLASHTGGWPGYLTFIDRHLSNDKTLIFLQNHNDASLPIRSVRAILYNRPLPVVKARKEITLPITQLEKLVGVYEVEKEFEIKITLDNNQLFAQLTGQKAFPIYPETETLFFLKIVDAQLQFYQNEKGEFVKLNLLQNGNTAKAKRVK